MHKELESYLDDVHSRLKAMPRQQRCEEIEEIRQHLESIVEDRIQAGVLTEDAVAEAIRRFGDPNTFAHGLLQAWRMRRRRGIKPWQWVMPTLSLLSLVGVILNWTIVPVDSFFAAWCRGDSWAEWWYNSIYNNSLWLDGSGMFSF